MNFWKREVQKSKEACWCSLLSFVFLKRYRKLDLRFSSWTPLGCTSSPPSSPINFRLRKSKRGFVCTTRGHARTWGDCVRNWSLYTTPWTPSTTKWGAKRNGGNVNTVEGKWELIHQDTGEVYRHYHRQPNSDCSRRYIYLARRKRPTRYRALTPYEEKNPWIN